MEKLTLGDMTYDTFMDKIRHLLGFWKVPVYSWFTGAYFGHEWLWLGWRELRAKRIIKR